MTFTFSCFFPSFLPSFQFIYPLIRPIIHRATGEGVEKKRKGTTKREKEREGGRGEKKIERPLTQPIEPRLSRRYPDSSTNLSLVRPSLSWVCGFGSFFGCGGNVSFFFLPSLEPLLIRPHSLEIIVRSEIQSSLDFLSPSQTDLHTTTAPLNSTPIPQHDRNTSSDPTNRPSPVGPSHQSTL